MFGQYIPLSVFVYAYRFIQFQGYPADILGSLWHTYSRWRFILSMEYNPEFGLAGVEIEVNSQIVERPEVNINGSRENTTITTYQPHTRNPPLSRKKAVQSYSISASRFKFKRPTYDQNPVFTVKDLHLSLACTHHELLQEAIGG
ncbi:hypothetical protein ARMGADRAFT_1038536 [Armillaria gallica]|uniref:Uncharacterized protein n=1 Tax=Armillaria gallica TaxID=47427 RepID=A0A2H3D0G5_ARMGA|nr:hypothetical protein ARMGADRAFT_1038536 [Armillaria gallica]